MGILLPALSAARAQARGIACMSNLRQIGNGLVMYSNDFHGGLMPAAFDEGGATRDLWPFVLVYGNYLPKQVASTPSVFICPTTADDTNLMTQLTSLYCDPGAIMFCSYGINAVDGHVESVPRASLPTQGGELNSTTPTLINSLHPSPLWRVDQ